MFIDIHSHKVNKINDTIIIPSYRFGYDTLPSVEYLSAAIHPWDVDNFDLLEEYERNINSFFMVSEVGLDKLYPSFEKQKQLFVAQLHLARKYNKPVVVHSVKSHNEVLLILRQFADLKLIIHSFVGSQHVADDYIKLGCYLSFSPLSLSSDKGVGVFQHTPTDRLFFESDATNAPVEVLYNLGAEKLSTNVDNLKKIIINNFNILCSKHVQSCY